MATAGKVTVAEVEHLVKPGEINPDHIMTPGIYVQRIVHVRRPVAEHELWRVLARRQRYDGSVWPPLKWTCLASLAMDTFNCSGESVASISRR
jgi:acyl CoA:acetate/3-ketoacid CoA transferase